MMNAIDLSALSTVKPATSYTSDSLHEPVKLRIGKQGIAAMTPETIPHFIRKQCKLFAKLPSLKYEIGEKIVSNGSKDKIIWKTVTYEDYAQNIEQAALILLHVGLQPHSSVGILAMNCPEWFYTSLGALQAGGVVAGIYPTNSPEAVCHVLDTSEATVCIVDNAHQMAKVRSVKTRLPRLRSVVQLYGPYDDFVGNEEGYYRWEDLICRQFDDHLRNELERREQDIGANECAYLIYTSGTTGMPKGVMLSHDSIIYETRAIAKSLHNVQNGHEVTVTYLPLSHIAANLFDIFIPLECGSCVYFADHNALKGTLGQTLTAARPTRLFGVPRIFEKIEEELKTVESKSSAFAKCISRAAQQAMLQYHLDTLENKESSHIKYWLASKVTNQIKYALGLNRVKAFFVGGAPVTEALKRFFLGLDMPLSDLYGLSEAGGATNMHNERVDLKTVGKALDCVEIKIHNPDGEGHGEICVRGRGCFMGYIGLPDKTKEVLMDDGWLHTGDVGYLDSDGNLAISGRIKELIITAGGENIPPAHIEGLIKRELPGISNALVVGDHRKYLTVLLTIKTDIDANSGQPLDTLRPEAAEWMESLGLEYKLLSQVLNIPADNKKFDASNVEIQPDPKVLESIEKGIKRANIDAISSAQRVQKFSILPHDFSLPTGELGPTLKVRRCLVLQKYANVIDRMYKQ